MSAATGSRAWRSVAIVATAGFAIGLVLLILAVYVPLPGWLGRWNDPTAWEPITIQVALGALAFGAWAWPNRHRERAFSLVFLALGTATVLVLGTAGYLSCPDATLSTGWSTAARVIGFLLGNYDLAGFGPGGTCGEGVPLALQFARLVQLTVLLVAASRAVAALLRGQLDRILTRLARRLVLVLGADETSASLLPALAGDGAAATRVIVTPDPAAPWVRGARATGWRVVAGDAADVSVLRPLLRRGREQHALRSLAVLPADSTATQRLVRAVERALDGTTSAHPVSALLRIDDAWQAEDWRRRYLGRAAEWIVDTISADEVTARLVVEDALRSGPDRLVVVGSSPLTFAVLAEIAQQSREHAVLGEAIVPPVVVLDPAASDVLAQHSFSQRRFGNDAELRATAVDAAATADSIRAAARRSAAPVILFIGDPDTGDAPRLAALLGAEAPNRLVYSRVADVAGLGAEPLLARVYAYGSTLDAGGRPVGNWERIARLGHERYVREHPDPDIRSRRPWEALAPFYRASNVRQVLTTLESAVAVGRSWGAASPKPGPAQTGSAQAGSAQTTDAAPSAEQLERMAQLEHESWRTHLLESGWRLGDVRDDAARRHPDLLSWDGLTDEARAKTREGVISSLELLATLGYRSFDEPAATWRTVRRRGVVFARPRDEAWTWTTHDGQTLSGAAGDWEVFDPRGHTHSVAAAVFEASHKRIDGDRWRRVGTVQVRAAREGERIVTLEGELVANAGEWVVRGDLGDEWIISAERLAAGYEASDVSG
jgi:hypothetical protein